MTYTAQGGGGQRPKKCVYLKSTSNLGFTLRNLSKVKRRWDLLYRPEAYLNPNGVLLD